jgi:hypothetical protein
VPESVLNSLIEERGGISTIAEIIVPEANRLLFCFKDGREESAAWQTSRRDSWTPEMKEKARQATIMRNKRQKEVAQ